jgi:cell division protein FtsB
MNLLEAKNQFNEKERGLRIAMEESEAANQVLSRSIEELTKQLQREETLRKEKAANVDNLQQQIDILLARARESENKCVKLRKTY